MNKKFLSAILFGALAVSAGSFVSCKSYDDDIDNLRKEIANMSSIKADASALSSAIDAAKSALQSDIKSAAQQAVADAKAQALEEAKKEIAKIQTGASMEEVQTAIANAIAKIEACGCDVDGKIAAAVAALAKSADVEALLSTEIQKLKVEMAALYLQQDALDKYAKTETVNNKIAEAQTALNAAIEAAKTAATADAVKAAKAAVAEAVAKVNSELVVLAGRLTGIIFQPEFYVDGIEAAQYSYLKYAALTANTDKYEGDKTNDKNNDVVVMAKPFNELYTVTQYYHSGNINVSVTPDCNLIPADGNNRYVGTMKVSKDTPDTLKYAMNPSTVKESDIKKITINAKNILAMTRAGEQPKFTVLSHKVNNGILEVAYKCENPEAIITANNEEDASVVNGKVNTTIVETQIAYKDTIISSDWAAIYETQTQPVAIAWNKKGDEQAKVKAAYCGSTLRDGNSYPELFKNPYEALKQKPSLTLNYNDNGYDLKPLLCIHMVDLDEERVNQVNNSAKPNDNTNKEIEASKHYSITFEQAEKQYGLTVEFKPVSYQTESDGNLTQPSNYINPEMGAEGHVVAGTVVADSDPLKGSFKAEQGVSSVTKQPLVQVLVKKGSEVVLEGYIKLQIVRETTNKVTPVIELGSKKYNCEGLEYTMTWSQASDIILQQTMNMSKAEFDASYKLLTNADGKCAIEFSEPADNKKIDLKNCYAIISEVPDPMGTTNTVLRVSLDKFAQQYILEDKNGKADFIVKYIPKSLDSDDYAVEPGVFVRLHVEITEEVSLLTMAKKIDQYWYDNGKAVNGVSDIVNTNTNDPSTMNVIRLNVNYPADNKASFKEPLVYSDGSTETEGFIREIRASFEVFDKTDKNDVVLYNGTTAYAVTDKTIATRGTAEATFKQTKFYFHPAVNGVTFVGDDKKTYELKVDNDFVICNKWIKEDGPKYKADNHRSGTAKLNHKLENISKQPLNYIEDLAKSSKLDVTKGIFTNDKLYARVKEGTTWGAWTEVASLKTTTGEIYYEYNAVSKALINAVGHTEARAMAFVGVYAVNACGDALGVSDGVIPAYFLRPLDMGKTKSGKVTDASDNGSYAELSKLSDFTDWRDVKITADNVTSFNENKGNGWLLAYYGVKSVTLDLKNITTNLNGYDINSKKLSDVTKLVKFSIVNANNSAATVLADMDELTTSIPYKYTNTCDLRPTYDVQNPYGLTKSSEVFEKVFGKVWLKYENNGLNVYDWKIRIPVTVGYDWGEFQTYVEVDVVKTINN